MNLKDKSNPIYYVKDFINDPSCKIFWCLLINYLLVTYLTFQEETKKLFIANTNTIHVIDVNLDESMIDQKQDDPESFTIDIKKN